MPCLSFAVDDAVDDSVDGDGSASRMNGDDARATMRRGNEKDAVASADDDGDARLVEITFRKGGKFAQWPKGCACRPVSVLLFTDTFHANHACSQFDSLPLTSLTIQVSWASTAPHVVPLAPCLDLSGGHAVVPHAPSLNLSSRGFVLEVTLRARALPRDAGAAAAAVLSKGTEGEGGWCLSLLHSGALRLVGFGASARQHQLGWDQAAAGRHVPKGCVYESTEAHVLVGTWHHLCISCSSSGTAELYVDGFAVETMVLRGAGAGAGAGAGDAGGARRFVSSTQPLVIGAVLGGGGGTAHAPFRGSIAQVRKWQRARSGESVEREWGRRARVGQCRAPLREVEWSADSASDDGSDGRCVLHFFCLLLLVCIILLFAHLFLFALTAATERGTTTSSCGRCSAPSRRAPEAALRRRARSPRTRCVAAKTRSTSASASPRVVARVSSIRAQTAFTARRWSSARVSAGASSTTRSEAPTRRASRAAAATTPAARRRRRGDAPRGAITSTPPRRRSLG